MDYTLTVGELGDPITEHLRRGVFTLTPGLTVGEALKVWRAEGPGSGGIAYGYVIDDEGRLIGVAPTRELLTSDPARPVGDLTTSRVISLPHTATVLDACELFLEHRFLALPVIDAEGRLLGQAEIGLFTDDLVDLAEHRQLQDVFQLIGIHADHGRERTLWAGFRDRFPWLLCNVAGGLLGGFVVSRYEALLDLAVVLALFIPVMLAVAESVSIQSMTLTLQALHADPEGRSTAEGRRRFARALGREMLQGALLGTGCGGLVGLTAWLWRGDAAVAAGIGVSILLAMITACLLGVLMPSVVHRFGRDPQVASGPIVLAATDVAALLFYFNLAGIVLSGRG